MTYTSRVSRKYWTTGRRLTENTLTLAGGCALVTLSMTMAIPYLIATIPAMLLMQENEGYEDCPKWLLFILVAVLAPGTAMIRVVEWTGRYAARSGWHRTGALVLTYAFTNAIFVGAIMLKFAPGSQPDLPEGVAWFLFASAMSSLPGNVGFMAHLATKDREEE